MTDRPPLGASLVGLAYLVVLVGAWLLAESMHIPTEPLWLITPLVLGVVLIGQPLSTIASNAKAAATQTNGSMDARIQAGVARALADRDAARTRQAVGDSGLSAPLPSRAVEGA